MDRVRSASPCEIIDSEDRDRCVDVGWDDDVDDDIDEPRDASVEDAR